MILENKPTGSVGYYERANSRGNLLQITKSRGFPNYKRFTFKTTNAAEGCRNRLSYKKPIHLR